MQKRGELSRLAVNLLIGSLIIILGVIIFFIVQGWDEQQEVYDDSNIDLKISQVKKVDENTLDVTLKRNLGEGEFVGLSFQVSDGSVTEVIRINSSMPENQTGNFSLKFILINASKIKKISVTPIYVDEEGKEVIGNVEDEYITPNTCSNYCPSGAQCGFNDCGMKCGMDCAPGYFCLNYKCIKQQSSSGGGGGSSEEEDQENNEEEICTSNCSGKECGSDGCDGNCGVCSSGYSCGLNGLCYNSLEIEEADYYVAPWGNDVWSGNFTHPWKTWSKAFHTAQAGDLVYFRGGTYYTEVTNGHGIVYDPEQGLGNDGTAANPIRYFNYPGEEPLLDCSNALVDDNDVFHRGISFYNLDYVHIKGLKLKSVHEDTEGNEYNGQKDVCYGIDLKKNYHIILENIEVYDVHGIGFAVGDDYYAEIINCDSHDNVDVYADAPGDYGMGFACGSPEEFTEGYTYLYGCRAWNNSDQGFSSPTHSRVVFDNCWSFGNDLLNWIRGDGHGWKIGYWYTPQTVNEPTVIIKNCIAANNMGDGMAGNEHGFAYTSPYHLYNNFIYGSGRFGISINNITNNLSSDQDELRRTLRNNIVYSNCFRYNLGVDCVDINSEGLYTHTNNSWDMNVNITDEDFVSLDVSQLYKPRKADGSLPDITFGHLAQGSDLIDKGVNVGIGYSGDAPDLGPFESNYSVSDCNCKSGEYCSNGVCLLTVPGNTYFVATNGNDNNPGTFEQPWKTWGKAFTSPSPGDIVYFRGGVYPMTITNGNGYNSINDGTSGNPVYYWAYPTDFASGNVPILDCENIIPSGDLNHGIYATADYVHFKGLTVRNVFQRDASDEAFAWRISGYNTTLELCTAYNVHGVGFRASTNATNMRFINCDAYNMVDYLDEAPLPGNDGYCFQVQNTQTTTGSVYFSGCRAWNCSDDGFTLFSRSYIEIDNCWSFSNGALQGAGNGWKLGFLPDGGEYAPLTRKITNSLGAYNRASGITSNDNNNEAVTMQLYNNLMYSSGYSSEYSGVSPGFYLYNTIYPDSEELKRVLRNNLAHANEYGPIRIAEGALYTHDHNSWDIPLTPTNQDFLLLPENQEQGFALLTAPRKADGSLPDLGNYFKLKQGSDLIDAGIVIPGHHCSTSGYHTGEDCVEWYGSAPDLGAFESNY